MSIHDDPQDQQAGRVVAAQGGAGGRIDAYWAAFFGIEVEEWKSPGVSFRPHVRLQGYRGLWCFRRAERVVVSAPRAWVARLEQLCAGWARGRFLDRATVAASLGEDCERCIGPVFQGGLDPERFQDVASPSVRPVLTSDRAGIDRFRERCGEEGWSVSGLKDVGKLAYVHADGAEITAMAGLREKSDEVGDLCVLTEPRFRGEGRGAAVVSAVSRHALARRYLLLYQTLEENRAAVRLAMSLGFERHATNLAVRLKHDAPQEAGG